jgi:hypothetical protein
MFPHPSNPLRTSTHPVGVNVFLLSADYAPNNPSNPRTPVPNLDPAGGVTRVYPVEGVAEDQAEEDVDAPQTRTYRPERRVGNIVAATSP